MTVDMHNGANFLLNTAMQALLVAYTGFCGTMLQKPLAPVEPPQTWPQTQWQDMQTLNTVGQRGAGSVSDDQGAPGVKLGGVTAPKPKYKLTGIKIGGKQVTLAKSGEQGHSSWLQNFSVTIFLVFAFLAFSCHDRHIYASLVAAATPPPAAPLPEFVNKLGESAVPYSAQTCSPTSLLVIQVGSQQLHVLLCLM